MIPDPAGHGDAAAAVAAILAAHPLFGKLGPAARAALGSESIIVRFAAAATIMRQDDPASCAYAILAGEVDIFAELPVGQIHLATVGRPLIFGELGALSGRPRTATVVARGDVELLRIERDSLLRLATAEPAIGLAIISELGARLHGVNRSLAYLTYAAMALGRDEYDPAMLAELIDQPGELAVFARAFATMAAEMQRKQQRRQELQAAAAIQASILPPPLARSEAPATVDLHAAVHPAREIGGDFYDYFWLGPDRLAITLADVSGKGIPAALFMAVARTVLRGAAGADLGERMTAANRLLSAHNAASMFVTLFHGVLDVGTGVLEYCNAGHHPPYLLRGAGRYARLPPTGIAFGIDPDLVYRAAQTRLAPGEALFAFSDGITDALNPAGQEFGIARLEAVLDSRECRGQCRGAAELVGEVLSATAEFTAGAEQYDDITCLALLWNGSGG